MPVIGEAHKGCRYWGYEPEYTDIARTTLNPKGERDAARDKLKALRAEVKAAGKKTGDMGLSKPRAIAAAEELEKAFPGHTWHVFNHDYL